jgi:hypothetical protein
LKLPFHLCQTTNNYTPTARVRVPNIHNGGDRFLQQRLTYLATGLLSYVAVTVLDRLANGFEGQMLRTEIYSIHGFSHLFFGFCGTFVLVNVVGDIQAQCNYVMSRRHSDLEGSIGFFVILYKHRASELMGGISD